MTLRGAIEEAKRAGDFSGLTDAIPYAQFLGISLDASTGELLGKLAFQPDNIGDPVKPALHGGTIGALLESICIFELLWQSETIVVPKTINITVDYLRSGRPTDTLSRATVTRQGRRVASVTAEAWQDDRSKPIAIAHAHFLVTPPE